MPELGKRLVHDEGVALIREWIAVMPVTVQKIAVDRSLRHDPYGILSPKSLVVPALIPTPLAQSELQPNR